jgi:hypothetical protein
MNIEEMKQQLESEIIDLKHKIEVNKTSIDEFRQEARELRDQLKTNERLLNAIHGRKRKAKKESASNE